MLGAIQLTDGLYALFAPRSFYEDFPFGRGWVEALPAYSEHLVRDVGSLFLATAVVLFAAAWFLGRRLIAITLVSFLVFSVPHFVYHSFNLEPYTTGDAVANVVGLAVHRRRADRPADRDAPPAGATRRSPDDGGNGRVEGVPDDTRNPFVRMAYSIVRRREGAVLDPLRIFAHHPILLAGYSSLELASRARARPSRRGSSTSPSCAPRCSAAASGASTTARRSARRRRSAGRTCEALPSYATSDRFDDDDRLVLDYATAMTRTPVDVSDELFERMRARFDERQLVELTSLIALENYRARFNWAFGLAGQGFSEGAYCVRPEPAER